MGSGWGRQTSGDDPGELRERVARAVHELRVQSGRSLAQLAKDAGIGKSTLHAIETAEANPGIETLWALARALDVPFGALLESPPAAVRVVRAGQGPRVDTADASMQARLLAISGHTARVEVYALELTPSEGRDAAPHADGTIEHVLVIAGRLEAGPADSPVVLGPGDFASFAGDRAHRYRALTPQTSAVLLIEYA